MGARPEWLRRIVVVAVVTGFLLGCSSQLSLRAPGVDLRQAKVVFMPSMVAVYRIQGCDLPFDDARSKAGRARVDAWLRYYAATGSWRLADLREVAGTEISAASFYDVMNGLAQALFADWGAKSLGAWQLPPLPSWAAALHADYVVFVVIRGAMLFQGADRTCQGGLVIPLRRAALVVVELQTGRIVRFQALKLQDIDSSHVADAVGKLMGSLDLAPAPAH